MNKKDENLPFDVQLISSFLITKIIFYRNNDRL